jgi:hypothetical protein
LRIADELGARSVAFPLISTGAFGWPRADAIAAAVDTIAATETRVEEVRLVAFEEAVHKQTRAEVLVRCPPPVGAATVGALFEREPRQYWLRGDGYLWRELRARFADTPLPEDWFTLRILITDAIEQVVGRSFVGAKTASWYDDPSAVVYVPEFNPGHGMSAGRVHLPWWAHTGVPILLDRYEARREGPAM